MACEGSKEVPVEGWAFDTYRGWRFGFNSLVSSIAAHTIAGHRLDSNIKQAKASICEGLCEDGCECKITDFGNPTAFNNPTVSHVSTARNWLGMSTAGRYDVTYHYIVKGECVDP